MCKLKLFTIQIAKLEFIFIILNTETKIHRQSWAMGMFSFSLDYVIS